MEIIIFCLAFWINVLCGIHIGITYAERKHEIPFKKRLKII